MTGIGSFNAELVWDANTNSFKVASVSAVPAGSRTCRVTMTGGYADIAIGSSSLSVTVVSSSNTLLFAPHYFSFVQGSSSGQAAAAPAPSGYTFVWQGADGFSGGTIPAGTQKTGVITWTNSWFVPGNLFNVVNGVTGESKTC